jgi:hypothetical protein
MDKPDYRALQELIESQGWEIFKRLVMGSLREQVQRNLQAETRRGDAIKAAQYVGQLDHLEVVLDVPRKEMLKLKG